MAGRSTTASLRERCQTFWGAVTAVLLALFAVNDPGLPLRLVVTGLTAENESKSKAPDDEDGEGGKLSASSLSGRRHVHRKRRQFVLPGCFAARPHHHQSSSVPHSMRPDDLVEDYHRRHGVGLPLLC